MKPQHGSPVKYPGRAVQTLRKDQPELREPTAQELEKSTVLFELIKTARERLEEAEAIYAQLQASCDHRVVYDTPGRPFHVRRCGACDKLLIALRADDKGAT